MTTSTDHQFPWSRDSQIGQGSALGEPNRRGDDIMFPDLMGRMIMGKFWAKSHLSDTTNTTLFSGMSPQFGRKVRFIREPEIIVNWRRRNDPIKHRSLRLNDFEVEVGKEADWSYKINDFDYKALWNSAQYQNLIIDGARKAMQAELQKRIIRYQLSRVACENWGNNAGLNGDLMLGDYDAPLVITADNLHLPFQVASVLFAERNMMPDAIQSQMGMSGFFAYVPPIFQGMVADSKLVDRMLMGNCPGGCEHLKEGHFTNYMGFDIYTNTCLPKITFADGSYGYPILMGAKGATGFTGLNEKIRMIEDDVDDWGVYLQGKFVSGWEVFWPEALVMFIVKFRWDGAMQVVTP